MNLTEINNLNADKKAMQIDKYKAKLAKITNIIAPLKVPYDDLSVLLQSSPELELVNKFFSDITCQDKDIERLL